MKWLAVTSLSVYRCNKENKQNGLISIWKNNTAEKAVALLGSINKELAALIKTKLCVDATRTILWIGKTKKWAPYLSTLNRIDLSKDLTVAILDWQYKEIAAILNHAKGFTQFISVSPVQGKEKFIANSRKR